MAEWLVWLNGAERDLQALHEQFAQTDPGVEVRDGRYLLVSQDFSLLTDSSDLRDAALGLISRINGVARIVWADFKPVEVDGIERVRADGKNDQFIFVQGIESHARVGIPSVSGEESVDPAVNPIETFLALSGSDANVEKALRIYGNRERDWTNLYNICEVIESDVGDVQAAGFASRSEITRFRHTANSARAIGDDARHGHERNDPPPRPMSIEEARAFVAQMLERWLRTKSR